MPTDSQPFSVNRIYHTPAFVTNHFLLILSPGSDLSQLWRSVTRTERNSNGRRSVIQKRVGFCQKLQSKKPGGGLPLDHEEFMRAPFLHNTFTGNDRSTSIQTSAIVHTSHDNGLVLKSRFRSHQRSALELEWLLIVLLLLVYFTGSYLFWARIEFVWPFGY